MEICQRCGESGEDRRTLWMACFYEMNELDIPFEQKVLLQAKPEQLTAAQAPVSVNMGGKSLNLQAGTVTCEGELRPQGLYTLRVCKECRADWLEQIQRWFNSVPQKTETGTGVYIREHGRNVELTEDEIRARFSDNS